MASSLIPFQPLLQPPLPSIEGNVDYRQMRHQLQRISQLLIQSGGEKQFISDSLQDRLARQPFANPKAQRRFQEHSRRALRCNIARSLFAEDFRGFALRLADSPLLQSFCGLSQLGTVSVPSKSTLQRYDQWLPETKVRGLVEQLLRSGLEEPQKLNLPEALDLEVYFLDTTCIKANIHYPVDWVLLRDATRTLMKAVRLIRDQGLKHRMEEPEAFIGRMNRLCIQMTHAPLQPERQRDRKRILRKMDKAVGVVRAHARRYRQILDEQWSETQWTRKQAEQVLRRMDQVLEQLPKARRQARQRILQGQALNNEEKILSLYQPQVQVIVRHKAGAEVEFGNTLLLGENRQGLIIDWKFFDLSAPADSRLVISSLDRTETSLRQKIKMLGGDRGFDSQSNQNQLAARKVYNAICPRAPQQLQKRNKSWKFKAAQKRRAQTEARIAIFKNSFLGSPLRSKGFAHRNLSVAWAVLTHNLWVMARMPEVAQAPPQQKAA